MTEYREKKDVCSVVFKTSLMSEPILENVK